jgi:type IV pilus assembly protein PilV
MKNQAVGLPPRRGLRPRAQRGVLLLEALVAILIFSLGVMGMVALGTASTASQSDARYRTEAANLANEIASQITVQVRRVKGEVDADELKLFAHQATTDGNCSFTGTSSDKAAVTEWIDKVLPSAGPSPLPGASDGRVQIAVDTATAGVGYNRVEVTLCWQAPHDKSVRRHTLVTYVN